MPAMFPLRRRAATALAAAVLAGLTGVALLSPAAPARAAVDTAVKVTADDETEPVAHGGDAADDPALWVDPGQPEQSLVIGNDKQGALEVYNLDGSRRQRITTASTFWGNVDVRQQVQVGGRTLDVAAVYNAGLRLFTVDASTRTLALSTDGGGVVPAPFGEGLCMYHSSVTGDTHVFFISRARHVRQYLLVDPDGDGLLQLSLERRFDMGSESEGCVADDERGFVYISQEDTGLWRYDAEPGSTSAPVLIDEVQPAGHLSVDVEGVTLVDTGTGGYLIASAQNIAAPKFSYFTVYDRITNAYVGSFRIMRGLAADGCQRTDGVTAYAGDLGPAYPQGVFVCQDNGNTEPFVGNQDFKLTRLEKVVDLG